MANKTCTFMMPEELWQVLKIISSENGEPTKNIVNTVLKKHLLHYAQDKNIGQNTLSLIETKLNATE